MNPLFDRYFSLPATVARHQSAPLAIERERFLTHLEAGGPGQQTIRTAACCLLQFVRKKLRKPRTVGKNFAIRAARTPQALRSSVLCRVRRFLPGGLVDRNAGHFMKGRMKEYGGLSLGHQATGGPSANRFNALRKFTLTDYCVELFTLLKCRKKLECFAVG